MTEYRLQTFGRRGGRPLRDEAQRLLDEVLPGVLFDPKAFQAPGAPTYLEIGFGKGEHLCAQAKQNPEACYIGAEVFWRGISGCMKEVEEHGIQNLAVYPDDVRDITETLPQNALDGVYILFPDPWPKLKHHKRRIIQLEFLKDLARIVKPGGFLQLGTDHWEYANWMLVHLMHSEHWKWTTETKSDWENPPEGYLKTRYQEKNKAGTDYPVFFKFERRD